MSDLKVPDTFCFIFSFRIPLSLALSQLLDNLAYPNFSFIPTFQLKTLAYA